MRVSVVINTYNRAASLRTTLQSLRYQIYPQFEVVVVKGPCTDETDAVLDEFRGEVRVGFCPETNLSKSRNVGIALASGDIVAFIDDDAVPDPLWLTELVAGYDGKQVGGVGGIVYDYTGYSLQYERCVTDRRAEPNFKVEPPLWGYNLPDGDGYVHLLGTNASFRRRCLEEIGGFDEEFEYFLDETEVCNRVIDRGYLLRLLPGAAVYHKYLPSDLRNENKVLRKPFSPVKNKFYYALRTARSDEPLENVLADCQDYAARLLRDAQSHRKHGQLTVAEFATFEADVERGMRRGTEQGLHARRQSAAIPASDPAAFLPFPILRPHRRLTVCFVSQEMPPESVGGIGRFTLDLARGFAAAGHEVHLLTRSHTHHRVDFEAGVWVHRLANDAGAPWNSPALPPLVRANLSRASVVYREIKRIGATRRIDLISAPIWDCEGLFCQLDDSLTCVLTLQTTMKTMTEVDPRWTNGSEVPERLALEQYAVRSAKWIHAISQNILDKVERDYGPPAGEAFVSHLGVVDRNGDYRPRRRGDRLRVLFVGRLEKRKGVDLFLAAAHRLTLEYPDVEFVLAGDNSIPSNDGPPYQTLFEQRHGRDPASQRVHFLGKISETDLYQEYADCDIFCLPARYESFGLVFLEAMQFGKPVIGTAIGGMTEIIEHGVNGFLAPPDDLAALIDHLRQLIASESLREELGRQSRRRFEERFSVHSMVDNTLRHYARIVESRRCA